MTHLALQEAGERGQPSPQLSSYPSGVWRVPDVGGPDPQPRGEHLVEVIDGHAELPGDARPVLVEVPGNCAGRFVMGNFDFAGDHDCVPAHLVGVEVEAYR